MQLLVLEKCIALLPARQSLEVFQLSAIEGPAGFTMVPALHFLNTDLSSTGSPDLLQGVSPACRQLASRGHWAEHCEVILLAAEITEPELLLLLLFLVSFCSVPSPLGKGASPLSSSAPASFASQPGPSESQSL